MINKDIFDLSRIPFFVCVGTNKNKIDMIAPCIGTILKRCEFDVLGTEDDNIHALNMHAKMAEINSIDTRMYQLIGIDASLGAKRCTTEAKPVRPGSGLEKDLPAIGEISLKLNINCDFDRDEQMRRLLEEHEKYEIETRILAAEVAHEIMMLYHFDFHRNSDLRALHNAKHILSGETSREIEEHQRYSKSTILNDMKRLKYINPYIHDLCMKKLKENREQAHLRGGFVTMKMWEAKRNEKIENQKPSIVGYNTSVVICDDISSNKTDTTN